MLKRSDVKYWLIQFQVDTKIKKMWVTLYFTVTSISCLLACILLEY